MRDDHTTVISDHVRPSPAEMARQLTPGSLLANRYRLVGPVGSGGMGVVYRADDIKVGQTVALKFIPPAVADDPALVAQLVAEVRVGRQVAHPNVCRMYDIVESDGQHFMAMEFVDGEDLASLLRRVGRLPAAKALDVARDVCLGLAAAHDLAIVHRDLKPANIMLDGRGRARITDFGLAASAAESSRHRGISGTPGYMAPEQARGEAVTPAADIYALGIVLYEIFTGRQAFHALSSAELIAINAAGVPPAAPSTIVPDIDPDVERTILDCLHPDPRKRPASPRQVLARLPARDVLEAAIAAGETPLPEVVAAAGARGNLRKPVAALLVGLTLIGTAAGVMLRGGSDRDRLLRQLKSPEVLRDRAAELASRLAPSSPKEGREHFGHVPNDSLVNSLRHVPGAGRWKPLVDRPHEAVLFWYRRGVLYAPSYFETVSFDDPPHIERGSVALLLDGAGRLRRFRHVPAAAAAAAPVNWQSWFADAGLDRRAFAPAAPPRTDLPPVPADRVEAWQSRDGRALLVVAGTRAGVPVFFDVVTPLDRKLSDEIAVDAVNPYAVAFGAVLLVISLAALLLARRNLNRGRVDHRGAWGLALFVFVTFTVSWLTSAARAKAMEGIAYGVLVAVVTALAYLALEPFVRRRWPTALVGWSRLLQRRHRDPHVGRDVLIGLAAAAASRVLVNLAAFALERADRPDTDPTRFRIPSTAWGMASELVYNFYLAVVMALCFLFVLYAITLIVRRRWIALAAVCLFLALLFAFNGGVAVIGLIAVLIVLDRFGLLAGIAMTYGSFLQAEIITFDFDRWYAGPSMLSLAILVALTLYAAGRSVGRGTGSGASLAAQSVS